MPQPDDVFRFFIQLPSILGPSRFHDRDAFSFGTVSDGATMVVDHLMYKYPPARSVFKNSNFSLKMKSLLNTHVEDGFLTRDALRERHWISRHMLARMCQVVLLNAVDHGTRSWDWVVQDVLLLSMLCGTVGRIGDLLYTYDKGNRFVAWRDITLKLITEACSGSDDGGGVAQQIEVLTIIIKLRYTKNSKYVTSSSLSLPPFLSLLPPRPHGPVGRSPTSRIPPQRPRGPT